MSKQAQYLFLSLALLVVLLFVVFVINQTYQVVVLASSIHTLLGRLVLIGLLLVYAALIVIPIAVFVRLPRALTPPDDEASPQFSAYLQSLGQRLAANPLLAGRDLDLYSRAGIEAALKILDARANEIIQATASTVFVTTAISQNGRLDGLMVLVTQSRMVWQIAHVYNQRPSLKEMTNLYANVAATAFLASRLEDLDLSDQVQPVIASAMGVSMAGIVPVASIMATIVTHALVEGAANAFLTLRVGVIARKRCGALTAAKRDALRSSAAAEAAGMLGVIMVKSAGVVTSAIGNAAVKAGLGTVKAGGKLVTKAANGVKSAATKAADGARSVGAAWADTYPGAD